MLTRIKVATQERSFSPAATNLYPPVAFARVREYRRVRAPEYRRLKACVYGNVLSFYGLKCKCDLTNQFLYATI